MKKYNLHSIMNRAWRFRREYNVSMSVALKTAWAYEKEGIKAEEIGKESGYDYYVSINAWNKYGKSRIYIETKTYYNHRKYRKSIYKCYIDNMTGEVVAA